MRLREFAGEDFKSPSPDQLLGLVQFLAGRADDTNSRQQISVDAFINLAQSLDINVTPDNIEEIIGQPPLSSVLEPMDPNNPGEIVFKGAGTPAPTEMPVNKAQDIVAAAAKSAMGIQRGV
jgi:hypothetical protein